MGPYIVDFVCLEARLAIEADGHGHGRPDGLEHDARRTQFLESQGLRVVRFSNRDILTRRRFVQENVWIALQERALHPGNRPVKSQGFSGPAGPHPGPLPFAFGQRERETDSFALSEISTISEALHPPPSPFSSVADEGRR